LASGYLLSDQLYLWGGHFNEFIVFVDKSDVVNNIKS